MYDADGSHFLKRPMSFIGSQVKASALLMKIGWDAQMGASAMGEECASQGRCVRMPFVYDNSRTRIKT